MDSIHFNWVVSSLPIKEEVSEPVPTLLSPPTTPSSFTLSSSPCLPPSRASRTNPSSPSTSGRTRPRPYPPTKPTLKKDPVSQSAPFDGMQWHTSGMRSSNRSIPDRRPSDSERHPSYDNNPQAMANVSYLICSYHSLVYSIRHRTS